MKKLIVLLFLIAAYQMNAQKNIDGLINAERTFAAYSVAHGTKDAFLKFLDSNGIVFDNGKAINGIEIWNKREKRSSILNWSPQFAEIASSNDFGYTSGPWELKPGANNDTVIARGQYTTVWHIDKNGEWKFLIDLGVGNTPKVLMLSLDKIKAKKITGDASTTEVLNAEQNFINAFKLNKEESYKNHLSKRSVLNRNGLNYPAIGKKGQSNMIESTPAGIAFTMLGSGIASSGDLAYVYGNTIVNNKPENYLHIWRKENGGWKIALEVLRY
jgi:ketosteroid isomerase-like protein